MKLFIIRFCIIIQQLCCFKQSIKCLFQYNKDFQWVIDLTFDCNEKSLSSSGCLTSVQVTQFYYDIVPYFIRLHGHHLEHFMQSESIISYTNYQLHYISPKSIYDKNNIKLESRAHIESTPITIAISIPFSTDSPTDLLSNRTIQFSHYKVKKSLNPNKKVFSSLIFISYEVTKHSIQNITSYHNEISLIDYKETSTNKSTEQKSNIFSVKRILEWISCSFSIQQAENRAIEYYTDKNLNLDIKEQKTPLGVIVFVDRLFSNLKIRTREYNFKKYKLLSSSNSNLSISYTNGQMFSFYNDGETMKDYIGDYKNYKDLKGEFEMIQINRKGEKIRRNK